MIDPALLAQLISSGRPFTLRDGTFSLQVGGLLTQDSVTTSTPQNHPPVAPPATTTSTPKVTREVPIPLLTGSKPKKSKIPVEAELSPEELQELTYRRELP